MFKYRKTVNSIIIVFCFFFFFIRLFDSIDFFFIYELIADFVRENVVDLNDSPEKLSCRFKAKPIYLGSLLFESTDDVIITSKGLRFVAPSAKQPQEKHELNIHKNEIVKIVGQFGKKTTLIIYVLNTCGKYIRERLEMSSENDSKQETFSFYLINS